MTGDANLPVALLTASAVAAAVWHYAASRRCRGGSAAGFCLTRVTRNTKGSGFEWKDPTSIYLDPSTFAACICDLEQQLRDRLITDSVDVVAAIDAAGYVVGAALADRLGTGLLTVRKGGSLPVPTDEVVYSYSKGTGKTMELRCPAFKPGTRVVVVDQWVDSGGSMRAAINLIERQEGVVVGVVALCIEDGPSEKKRENARWLRGRYPCVTLIQPASDEQQQCNAHMLVSWQSEKL
jgi:adenine phosphoribosyltransferase